MGDYPPVLKVGDLSPSPPLLRRLCTQYRDVNVTQFLSFDSVMVADVTKLIHDAPKSSLGWIRFHVAAIKKFSMDVNTLRNYRPISNLSFVSKLLERLVSTQLQSQVDTHSLLPPNQSAHRRSHSTETALLKVYSDLSALDSSSDDQSVLAVLDMTAAFDTVDQSILLRRLERSYGVSGNALWFISVR